MKQELIEYLSRFVTQKRFELFKRIAAQRTRYITVLLEDIYQAHNASAVLRSCDCFGIQDVHIIENRNEYQVNPDVAVGASAWLDIKKYNRLENNTLEAIKKLKKKGYRIVATTPHKNVSYPDNFPIEKGKLALMFGSEMPGLSDIAMQNADEFLKIPMYGFTESFNISVSAAVILNRLSERLRKSDIEFQLDKEEQNELIECWLRKSIKSSELIVKKFSAGK